MWIGGIPFGYCKGLCANCEDPNGKDYCPNFGNKNLGDGKNIIAHPIESLAVKMVFDWYATGQYTQVQIVHILNETKVRLPDGSEVQLRQKGRKSPTNPGLFGRDTIRDLLRRYSYTGKIPYQGRRSRPSPQTQAAIGSTGWQSPRAGQRRAFQQGAGNPGPGQ